MAKILFGISALLILTFIIIAMYCDLVIAGRSDDDGNVNNNGGDDEMFWEKQICPKCKVGKESYELDRHSDACPYIGCWKDGKCHFYVPLDNPPKKGIFKKNKNKTKTLSSKISKLVSQF